MSTFDFDFQRYVERKKGARDAERREGAGYAYAGDLRIRKLLGRARPVSLALEATVRLWRATARAELLGTALKVTAESFPRVQQAAERAAAQLHVTLPPLYVSPHLRLLCHTFGTDDEPQVVLHAGLADTLTDEELVHVMGTELGRIQNNHVLLGTAYYYLVRGGSRFVRWIVRPAVISLAAWSRRAEVTADRAGLLASRDLSTSIAALGALAKQARATRGDGTGASRVDTDTDDDEDARDTETGRAGTAEGSPAGVEARRAAALTVWSRSSYYLGALGQPGGLSPSETEKETARALRSGESFAPGDPNAGGAG